MRNPREVEVDVIIDNPNSNPPKFHFETTDLPMGPNNHLYFQNCGHPGLHVRYTLKNPPANYLFPPPSKKEMALVSQQGLGCPAQTANSWDDFKAISVTPNRLTLLVHNKNSKKEDFGYTLFVTNDNGATYLPLDPGGTNQNGQYEPFEWSYVTVAVVTGVVSAFATTALVAAFT